MRTIKFRGKRIDEPHQWEYGYIQVDGKDVWMHSIDGRVMLAIPETVGQFTGLYDKMGCEIFEGDIIGCGRPGINHLIFYNEKEGRFMAALNGKIEDAYFGVCGLDDQRWVASKTVIGNIHDNPDLIEKGLTDGRGTDSDT